MDIFGGHKLETKSSLTSIPICFSLIRNTTILFKNQPTNEKQQNDSDIEHRFVYLHGIRAILVIWIIATHAVSLIPASITMPVAILARHPHDMIEMAKNNGVMGNFLSNGTLAVEAFFFIR